MSTEKKREISKQEPKRSEPLSRTTKMDEIELSEKDLGRTTGGTGKRQH